MYKKGWILLLILLCVAFLLTSGMRNRVEKEKAELIRALEPEKSSAFLIGKEGQFINRGRAR